MKDLVKTADALLRDLYGHQPPKPRYPKGDTTAARARLAELRAKEALNLRVPAELIVPADALAARYWAKNGSWRVPVPIGEPGPSRPAISSRTAPSDGGEQAAVAALPVAPPGQKMKYPASVSTTAIAVASVSGCRFPLGDPGADNFSFCNAKATHGAYCECHHKRMWGQ